MKPALAIHGGAGVLRADRPGAPHRAVLEEALHAAYEILLRDGKAVDAVTAAVVVLEDSPLFNAGRGSSFNGDGEIGMDASIMDGATLRAGAVAAVRHVRNPILAARAVMRASRHVLLAADGAERELVMQPVQERGQIGQALADVPPQPGAQDAAVARIDEHLVHAERDAVAALAEVAHAHR